MYASSKTRCGTLLVTITAITQEGEEWYLRVAKRAVTSVHVERTERPCMFVCLAAWMGRLAQGCVSDVPIGVDDDIWVLQGRREVLWTTSQSTNVSILQKTIDDR